MTAVSSRPGRADGSPSAWLGRLLAATGAGSSGPNLYQCPAHADGDPSLRVEPGRAVPTVVVCRAGCSTAEVLDALRLRFEHLWTSPPCSPADWIAIQDVRVTYPPVVRKSRRAGADPSWRLETVHEYGADFRLERWRNSAGAKDLRWFSRNPRGEMVPGLLGRPLTALPLYEQYHSAQSDAVGDPLFIVESESSVDALTRAGHYSLTWAGGAGNPPLRQLATVVGGHRDARVVADHDRAGIAVARRLLDALPAATGWIPPTPGHDIRDVITHGDRRLATLARLETGRTSTG